VILFFLLEVGKGKRRRQYRETFSSIIMEFSVVFVTVLSSIDFINCEFVARAISNILLDLNKPRIDLISYQDGPSIFVDELFYNVTKSIDGRTAITINTNVASVPIPFGEKKAKLQLNVSSVLVFDSIARFEEIFQYIIWQDALKSERLIHTIHIRDKEIKLKQLRLFALYLAIPKYDYWYLFTNFLFDDDNYVSLSRVTAFLESSCEVKNIEKINKLDKKTGKWESNNFGIRKITNFNGCTLVFGITVPFATYIKRGQVLGHTHDVLTYLSKKLNFSIQYTVPAESDEYREGVHLELDISYGEYVWKPYIFDEAFFFVPVGEEYSSYEKLFLPFWWDVWLAVALTLLIALVVIALAELCKCRDFVFGSRVKMPTLNLAIAFFGGGQMILPSRNFARFLLMMFILWSLVIRTCYQGEYFNYLQMDTRKPTIQTIDEIIARNLTIYAELKLYEYLNSMETFEK